MLVTSAVPNSRGPWTVAHQAPLSMGFSRQEYWSGLPYPSPGDLPVPGVESESLHWQAGSLPLAPPGKPIKFLSRFSRVRPCVRLWDSPGKNTGVGCHFLLQCMKVKSESGCHCRLHKISSRSQKTPLASKRSPLCHPKCHQKALPKM